MSTIEQAVPGRPARASAAVRVFVGIFLSRVIGFLRDRALAHYFGVGAHSDVFRTALRGPNVLQNLLGEGTISAAFIPIYSRMVEDGRRAEAGRFAGAIFGLLVAAASLLSLAGVLLARPLVTLLAPGFLADADAVAAGLQTVDRFPLAVDAVRIIFPMTGVLVLSAWALGVLNSHRRFLLPYLAPVLWNAAIIAALVFVARSGDGNRNRLLTAACVGALVGGVLQFAVQLPLVLRELHGFRISLSTRVEGVADALRAFGPVVAGRGVYQISAYLDLLLASLLAAGAVGALGWAQALYVLPVSLFGLSVVAAELPELARAANAVDRGFTERMTRSLAQMAFMTVPTLIGYLAFGYLVVGALYRTGSFGRLDNWLVYLLLAGYSLGLLATTSSRLLQNAFYALRDTRTPARIAVVRVVASALIGLPLMLWLDRLPLAQFIPQPDPQDGLRLGGVGLAVASAIAAWVELAVLIRSLARRIEGFSLPIRRVANMTGLAVAAAIPAAVGWWLLPRDLHVVVVAAAVLGGYAAIYLGSAWLLRMPELRLWIGRLAR